MYHLILISIGFLSTNITIIFLRPIAFKIKLIKLKTDVEKELPEITALKLKVAFFEDRIDKAETLIDKLRNNGTHKGE